MTVGPCSQRRGRPPPAWPRAPTSPTQAPRQPQPLTPTVSSPTLSCPSGCRGGCSKAESWLRAGPFPRPGRVCAPSQPPESKASCSCTGCPSPSDPGLGCSGSGPCPWRPSRCCHHPWQVWAKCSGDEGLGPGGWATSQAATPPASVPGPRPQVPLALGKQGAARSPPCLHLGPTCGPWGAHVRPVSLGRGTPGPLWASYRTVLDFSARL